MLWSRDHEVIIDPIVLALVWSDFAPGDLRRKRTEEGESEEGETEPTDTEEEAYIADTSTALFGDDSSRYPMDFLKGTLLFTTRIRTLFSGSKFSSFHDMLHDNVGTKHHKELRHLRPLFDDPSYESFRRGSSFRTRPWDLAVSGISPADLGIGAADHFFKMSTASTLGQGLRLIFRFLNEDMDAEYLIDDVNGLSWPDGEPLDFSLGFHQFVIDYLAMHQFSFGRPLFSLNEASPWIRMGRRRSEIDEGRQIEHAITVTMPTFSKLSLNDVFELRKHRFFKCYRKIVESGGVQALERSDVDNMLKAAILTGFDESAFGAKDLAIDLGKLILSVIPAAGILAEGAKVVLENGNTAIELGGAAGSSRSRFRRFKNRWLHFVKNARERTGGLGITP